MAAELRALGGMIENIRVGTGPRGRGLFSIDNTKPVILRLPENLLFSADDIEFVTDRIRLKDTASVGRAEREFFEKYEKRFSRGSEGRLEWTAFETALDALPTEVRALLATEFAIAKRLEGDAHTRAARQFLANRQIGWKDKGVIVPLLELANHGEEGLQCEFGPGLGIEGVVCEEVLVSRGAQDAWSLFFNSGHANPAIGAFSLPVIMNLGSIELAIGSAIHRSVPCGNYLVPEVAREGSRVSLSHLMLGHAPYPSASRGIFRTLMKEIFGESTDEVFDSVRHFNRGKFFLLLAALEQHDGPMITELGKMARFQLEAISWSIGSTDLHAPVPARWRETETSRAAGSPAAAGWTWDAMLDAFRSLGGVAENIRLSYGASGRGLFPVYTAQPFRLRVPQNLLLPASDIMFADGKIGIRPEAAIGPPEREFLAHYQEAFSWGGGGQCESAAFVAELEGLPSDLRELLVAQFGMGDLLEGDADARAQRRFLRSRIVEWNGRAVVIPLAELANHRPDGVPYGGDDFLEIAGKSSGEIFVSYRRADAFEFFRRFGFASPEPGAFCLPMKAKAGQFELIIERNIDPRAKREPIVMPQLRRDEGRLVLSSLPLGHPNFPRASRGIFRALMRNADIADNEADEAFDRILHFNRLRFVTLLDALASLDGKLVETLRKMARFQLEAMSWCIGTREV